MELEYTQIIILNESIDPIQTPNFKGFASFAVDNVDRYLDSPSTRLLSLIPLSYFQLYFAVNTDNSMEP